MSLRLSAVVVCVASFSPLFAQAPSNNECATPIVVQDGVNPAPAAGASGTVYTNVAATASAGFPSTGCSTSNHFFSDVFFSYTATTTGTTRFSTCTPSGFAAGTLNDSVLSVYSGSACPAGGAPLLCNDQFCGGLSEVALAVTAGSNYLVRVGSWSSGATGTFYLTVRPDFDNDECLTADALAPGVNFGSTFGATASVDLDAGCFGATAADRWHAITPAVNCDLTFSLTGGGANRLLVTSGACGAQFYVGCDAAAPYSVTVLAVAGVTYFARVAQTVPGAAGGYVLTVDCPAAPTNDECSSAIPVEVGVNPSAPAGASGGFFSNVNASDSSAFAASSACAGAGHPGRRDVFFSFWSQIDGPVRFSTCTPSGFTAGTLSDTVLELYADCSGGAALACNDQFCASRSELTFSVARGVTYYVRVSSWDNGAVPAEGTFYLTIEPTNEDCATAQPIAPGDYGGTTVSSVASGVASSCANVQTGADVWYSFSLPAVCDVSVAAGGYGFDGFAVYQGTCGSLTQVACDQTNPFGVVLSDAAPGTYYVRVANSGAATAGAFVLYLTCLAPPTNDDCANAIDVFAGINPNPPAGPPAAAFTNQYATTQPGFSSCATLNSDVWFRYVAVGSGPCTVTTVTPSGAPPGSLTDTVLSIHADCATSTPIACNDQTGGDNLSTASFSATSGVAYYVRVGGWSGTPEGTFYLTVKQDYRIDLVSAAPGQLEIRNENGFAGRTYLNVFTLNGGSFPSGPFFGIDPTFTELYLQIVSGAAPNFGVLGPDGTAVFGPLVGFPPLTIYATSVEFTPGGLIGRIAKPVVRTIL